MFETLIGVLIFLSNPTLPDANGEDLAEPRGAEPLRSRYSALFVNYTQFPVQNIETISKQYTLEVGKHHP